MDSIYYYDSSMAVVLEIDGEHAVLVSICLLTAHDSRGQHTIVCPCTKKHSLIVFKGRIETPGKEDQHTCTRDKANKEGEIGEV